MTFRKWGFELFSPLPFLILFLLLIVYPLIMSFNLILSNLETLRKVFANELYWRALFNTFLFFSYCCANKNDVSFIFVGIY